MSMKSNHISETIVSMLLLMMMITPATVSFSASTPHDPIALPGCQDHCGNISIPYPFGIGPKCSHNPWFQIFCDESSNPPRAYSTSLKRNFIPQKNITDVQILAIDVETSPLQPTNYGPPISTLVATRLRGGITSNEQNAVNVLIELDMRGSPFVLMGTHNSLVVSGCGGSAVIRNSHHEIVAGCSTVCSNLTVNEIGGGGGGGCYGIGCCHTSVATSLDYFQMEYLTTVLQGSQASDWIWAALANYSYLEKLTIVNTTVLQTEFLPAILQWAVPDLPVSSAEYSNSQCELDVNLKGYSCRCRHDYYRGNPYLPNGCQVIKECKECLETCASAIVGNIRGYRCPSKLRKSPMPLVLGLGISLGTLLLSILLYAMYRLLKQRKEIRQKKENFKRNGGLLLQEQLPASEGAIERTKVYTSNELEKATDNFNENRIVGRGGQGTVYKGMLDDGTIVAIKKSKKVSKSSQLKQFINEVVILSQINHRYVVKLFGCCLETEVPLLVYEYVINGTLSQNISNSTEEFYITWRMRLQIAIQSAEALAYLHSSSYPPIFHRDIKTSNILLDDKYRAKVSDFGISKSIEIDQTHVTNTHVEGTFGYIDPEFYRSHQYTDKSDVYSFGVVLVELITSKKAVYEDNSSAINLASTFLYLKQSSRLYDIVDAKVLEEARKEELEGVADLAEQCLLMTGRQRPTMKEVVMTLLMITSQPRVPISSSDQVFDGKLDFVGELSSSNSIIYPSSEDPTQPLFSSTFSSSTDFGM